MHNNERYVGYAPFALIKEGKLEEAYNLLIADKKNEKAIELLSRFKVVYTKLLASYRGGAYATDEFEYDSRGRLLKNTALSRSGDPMTTEWEYYENGDVSKRIRDRSYGDQEIIEYIYDSRRNKIKEVIKCGEFTKVIEHIYNDDDMPIKRITIDQDDNVETEESFYDSNKRLVKKISTDFDGNIHVYEHTYDAVGNMVKCVASDEDGQTSLEEYEYDENGNRKKWTRSYHGKKDVYEFVKDSNGNLIKWTCFLSSGGWGANEYFYDENGNMVNRRVTNSDESIFFEEEYEYDENGNLKRVVTKAEDGVLSTVEYLDYLYFYYPDGLPKNDLKDFSLRRF